MVNLSEIRFQSRQNSQANRYSLSLASVSSSDSDSDSVSSRPPGPFFVAPIGLALDFFNAALAAAAALAFPCVS